MATASGVAPAQFRALGRIGELSQARHLYLVGGTALAHYFGHRTSTDLDLFSLKGHVDFAAFKRIASSRRDVRLVRETDAVLKLRIARVPVDIVRYPYPPLEKPRPGPSGFPTAGIIDLATMKLAAISKRGIRRDFWDLDEILRSGLTLHDALRAYVKRFRRAGSDVYHVIRSLTYFEDAENDPRWPRGLTAARWSSIKANMEAAAAQAMARLAGPR